jgi:hypothetical protein
MRVLRKSHAATGQGMNANERGSVSSPQRVHALVPLLVGHLEYRRITGRYARQVMPSTYVQRCAEGQKPVKDFKCA